MQGTLPFNLVFVHIFLFRWLLSIVLSVLVLLYVVFVRFCSLCYFIIFCFRPRWFLQNCLIYNIKGKKTKNNNNKRTRKIQILSESFDCLMGGLRLWAVWLRVFAGPHWWSCGSSSTSYPRVGCFVSFLYICNDKEKRELCPAGGWKIMLCNPFMELLLLLLINRGDRFVGTHLCIYPFCYFYLFYWNILALVEFYRSLMRLKI